MRLRAFVLVSLMSSALFPVGEARADGWTQPEGHCYAKLGSRLLIGSSAYLATGLRDSQGGVVDYQDVQLSLYGECGLHPQLSVVVAAAPFGYANASRETFYVGPLGAALRFDPIGDGGSTRLAFQLGYSYAPAVGDGLLYEMPGASPPVIYRAALENHYGEATVQLGQAIPVSDEVNGWVSGHLGARIHSASSMTPALIASVQVGLTFFGWLTAELHFPLYEPFFHELEETNVSGVGQTRYLGFGISVSAWFIDSLAIFAGLDGVFYASSNAATPAIMFGLESRFNAWGEGS